jgi:hypothetical protein
MRLSIVIEWANTRLNGVSRAWTLLEVLGRQWRAITDRQYPEAPPAAASRFLDGLGCRAEVLIVSGSPLGDEVEDQIRRRTAGVFDVRIHVAEGLEYYPLKNFGGGLAGGDLLLFVDSDIVPDDGWLAHLLGSFAVPEVHVVCGQTYVAPTDLLSRAFAVGWTYELRNRSAQLFRPRKFYANSIAFRAEVFRQTGFPSIGRRTRGAASRLGEELARLNRPVWENPAAAVAHPPPSSFRHFAVRGLAHGRDHYMKDSEERHLSGLARSIGVAAARLGRAFYRTVYERRCVGLRVWEVPAALAICSTFHAFFALGGVLTHISPRWAGRCFRV